MASDSVVSSPVARPWLFLWLRSRLFHNNLSLLLRTARLRLVLVVVFSAVLWGLLYYLFARGFDFLRQLESAFPVKPQVIDAVFGMFFLTLTGLMIFSTSLLLYGSLFRAPEAEFLLTTPARPDHIFAYKFHEALFFSGWGFLLLGTPLLVAYGIEMSASWLYYLLFIPQLLGFLLFPGALGALGCLLVVHFVPRKRKQVLFGLIALLLALLVGWAFPLTIGTLADKGAQTEEWLRKLMEEPQASRLFFFPSEWLTQGLTTAANGNYSFPNYGALFYLALIWANGLISYLFCALTARAIYRAAYNRVASAGNPKRRYAVAWPERVASWMLFWTDKRTRMFVVKDMLTFRRDPMQWAQVLILGGILLIYFLNLPRLVQSQAFLYQRSTISFLNLSVLSLMLAVYTCRFVFPMMSLEGNKFWVLGLLPLDRNRLLYSKFIYAVSFTVTTSLILALVSGFMLRLPWPIVLLHCLAALMLSLGLSGISVGLGAALINLKENNPSKIATGFGGTINLLVSLAFAVAVDVLAAGPALWYFAHQELRQQEKLILERIGTGLIISTVVLVVLGAVAVLWPMQLGKKAFREMEF